MPWPCSGWRSLSRVCPHASHSRIRTASPTATLRRSDPRITTIRARCRRRRARHCRRRYDRFAAEPGSLRLSEASLAAAGWRAGRDQSEWWQAGHPVRFRSRASLAKTDAEQKARHYLKDPSLVSTIGSRSVPSWPAAQAHQARLVREGPRAYAMPSDGFRSIRVFRFDSGLSEQHAA